jgi:hypothetical protein
MMSPSSSDQHLVRPRRVWIGTLLAILGLVLVSVGLVLLSWPWSLTGTVIALGGAVVAWRGGILYDVHSSGAMSELGEVVHGTVREGVAPGETVHASPEARRRTVQVERRRRGLERAATMSPRPGPTRPAGWLLMLIAIFLMVAQWTLYPLERPGQTNAVRALGAAIVLGIAGMRMASSPERPPRVAALVSIAVGLALLLNGVLAEHDVGSTAAAEGVCGALACLAGTAVLVARSSRRHRVR